MPEEYLALVTAMKSLTQERETGLYRWEWVFQIEG